ncbi:MAG: hypothetical protein ACOCXO_02595 [Bacteroidota bacterium]
MSRQATCPDRDKISVSQETGIRFRDLILAKGDQKDIMENVEEFPGRPSNNQAYIESLGLE